MRISCVCPTRESRRGFLMEMVNCFTSQTFPDKELIILDECTHAWTSFPVADNIRYVAVPQSGATLTVGAKRNMVNELTSGDIIAHFDDDDWSHPMRLANQFATLQLSGKQMVGFHDLLYFRVKDRSLWKYVYQGKPQPYATGTSQMYYKSAWAANKFKHKIVGEDSEFSFDLCKKNQLASVEGAKMIVARAHSGNTYVPQFGSAPFLPAVREDFPQEFLSLVGL